MANFVTAWKAFWRIIKEPQAADAWRQVSDAMNARPIPEKGVDSAGEDISADAVYSLVLLQRTGRLVDFLNENISAYSDEQVGAASRQIHEKCKTVLEENFAVEPVLSQAEGAEIEIPSGFDPSSIRLLGKVKGEPPFKGTVRHPGWRVGKVDFPERHSVLDPTVIAPAEVEI